MPQCIQVSDVHGALPSHRHAFVDAPGRGWYFRATPASPDEAVQDLIKQAKSAPPACVSKSNSGKPRYEHQAVCEQSDQSHPYTKFQVPVGIVLGENSGVGGEQKTEQNHLG